MTTVGSSSQVPFEAELKRKGIWHEKTVPRKPSQNGVAERFNRTLKEGVRALRRRAGLPDNFWVCALRQMVSVKNRVLATVGNTQFIPYMRWYGSSPRVDMIRAFGCMCVFHVPKEMRGSLEPAGKWGVHLGLAKDHKGWLVWDISRQKPVVSRDVKFLESLYYGEWKQQQQGLPKTPLIIEKEELQQRPRVVQFDLSDNERSDVTNEDPDSEGEHPEPVMRQQQVQVQRQQVQVQRVTTRVQQQQGQEQQPQDQGAATSAPTLPPRERKKPNRLTYLQMGNPLTPAGSVAEVGEDEETELCFGVAAAEPTTFHEAVSGPDRDKWKASIQEEYDSLLENGTWELTQLPPGKKAITTKWVFRHKFGPDGELTRYKTRLVAKGFQQRKGIDYDEVFAPVGKGTTLRVLLAAAANLGWRIEQMDIKTAFLHGDVEEELYMEQPEGMEDGSGRVCRLRKAIYGLKQAPRAWYHKLEETLLEGGFKKSVSDHSLFLLCEGEDFLMMLVYVDDILLFSSSSPLISKVQGLLENRFKCSKMGEVKYYLGMHVEREMDKGVLRLNQRKYCEGLAERYGLDLKDKPDTPTFRFQWTAMW